MSLTRATSRASVGGGCGAWRTVSTPAPTCGAIVWSAAIRCARKRARSLSPSSSANQAAGRSPPLAQALASVVFPKPAGAEMSVRLWCRPSFSRASKRGRLTRFGRGEGTNSLVTRTDADIGGPPTDGRLRVKRWWKGDDGRSLITRRVAVETDGVALFGSIDARIFNHGPAVVKRQPQEAGRPP